MTERRARCPWCAATVSVAPAHGGDGKLDVFRRHERADRTGGCEYASMVVLDDQYVDDEGA